MRDHTFYIVCAYGVTALAIALEVLATIRHRRQVRDRAQAQHQEQL